MRRNKRSKTYAVEMSRGISWSGDSDRGDPGSEANLGGEEVMKGMVRE